MTTTTLLWRIPTWAQWPSLKWRCPVHPVKTLYELMAVGSFRNDRTQRLSQQFNFITDRENNPSTQCWLPTNALRTWRKNSGTTRSLQVTASTLLLTSQELQSCVIYANELTLEKISMTAWARLWAISLRSLPNCSCKKSRRKPLLLLWMSTQFEDSDRLWGESTPQDQIWIEFTTNGARETKAWRWKVCFLV